MPLPLALFCWYLPVLLAMGYDYATRHHVHPIYWIGIVAMSVSLVRLPLGDMDAWLGVGRPIIGAIT